MTGKKKKQGGKSQNETIPPTNLQEPTSYS